MNYRLAVVVLMLASIIINAWAFIEGPRVSTDYANVALALVCSAIFGYHLVSLVHESWNNARTSSRQPLDTNADD